MNSIKELVDTIDGAIENFNKDIPAIQLEMARRLELMLKEVEVDANGNIKPSVANLKLVGRIKASLDDLFRKSSYFESVKQYVKAFGESSSLMNKYFADIQKDFKPKPLIAEIRKQSIEDIVQRLTGDGIKQNVTSAIGDMLTKATTTGGAYTKMSAMVRDAIITNESGSGLLERYTKQITTDALNQFSGQVLNAVTNDLGLQWFMYTGSLIRTSRAFCEACVKKKYIHASEIPALLKGDFPEFEAADGTINKNTDLPEGMIKGTTPENFHVYRGGYNCGHQLVPISASSVPALIRQKFETPEGYKEDSHRGKNQARTLVHDNADSEHLDFNIQHSRILNDNGVTVKIKEHSNEKGVKNPELEFLSGQTGDYKKPKSESLNSGIRNGLNKANTQKANIPVFIIERSKYVRLDVIRALNGEVKAGNLKNIDEVWLMIDREVIQITRKEIEDKSYYSKLP